MLELDCAMCGVMKKKGKERKEILMKTAPVYYQNHPGLVIVCDLLASSVYWWMETMMEGDFNNGDEPRISLLPPLDMGHKHIDGIWCSS
jgi:hypothetical protein